MTYTRRPRARAAVSVGWLLLLLLPLAAAASKPQPIVLGSWQNVPASVPVGQCFTIVLRLRATRDASDVTVELLPSRGVEVTTGDGQWTGALTAQNVQDLSFAVRIVANGNWTLGARITNTLDDGKQVSGAVLGITAKNGIARLAPR